MDNLKTIFEYTFKNKGLGNYNDNVYDDTVFDIRDKEFTFSLKPSNTTKFWRFGMAFSKSETFIFEPNKGRYDNHDLKYIEIDVGDMSDYKWGNPNRIYLGSYYIEGFENKAVVQENYVPSSEVKLKIKLSDQSTYVSFNSQESSGAEHFLIKGYNYFKIFAWANTIDFEIECKAEINLRNSSNQKDSKNPNNLIVETPDEFSRYLYEYIKTLPMNYRIKGWEFIGETNIAYGTPGGSWDLPGFTFKNDEYSFIIRSISKNQHSVGGNYLVVESNNLRGQLVNHYLDSYEKFLVEGGKVTLLENFDMTVGLGRRSRNDVKKAFEQFNFENNIISSFKTDNINWDQVINDILNWSTTREKAKKYLQENDNKQNQSSSIEEKNKFWLLKIYGDNWVLPNIKEGDEGHFNSHFNSFEKRPEYENFLMIKSGDKGFAYDFSSNQAIVFLFEIIKPLHFDNSREEIFTFKVTRILKPGLGISTFSSYIPISNQLNKETLNKLFQFSEAEYNTIYNLIVAHLESTLDIILENNFFIAEVLSDSSEKNIEDELGFESDVTALASVIAYKEVKPPIAVGLFGNWGSGKSFFMNKLQEKISELGKSNDSLFCEKVLQINFNSWHYSDTNLWASLITKIFEDLETYGKGKADVIELFKNLHSTKEFLQDTEIKKEIVDKKIAVLKDQSLILEQKVKEKSDSLQSLNLIEITREMLKNDLVQEDIDKLNEEYSFLKLKEYDDIDRNIKTLETLGDKAIQGFKILYSFRNGKAIMPLLITLLVSFLVFILITNVNFAKRNFEDYKTFIVIISGLLTNFMIGLQPIINIINKALVKLKSINKTLISLKTKARTKFHQEQEELEIKLKALKDEYDKIQIEVELLGVQQQNLQDEIDQIISGKKIIKFIERKVTDERYINSLGIISWIRKDFEELDFLLKQQYDAKALAESGREKVEIVFQLERIILYIDDLDRCHETIVVKVLEAIHLLLAFPLFVVVVGVDPRWMHNALNVKYSHLLSESNENKHQKELKNISGQVATSFDYLEKIFQIPFALKKIDQSGKFNLIKSQLEQKKKEEKIFIREIEFSEPNQKQNIEIELENDSVEKPLIKDQTIKSEENIKPVLESLREVTYQSKKNNPTNRELLKISVDEIKFMQEISFLIGDSPRTIKRYINIYRIIRTHSLFQITTNNGLEYYYAAMVLLSVITGIPDIAKKFFESVNSSDETQRFSNFLEAYLSAYSNSEKLFQLRTLSERIKNVKADSISSLNDITMERFKKNTQLISRFSFRGLNN